MKILKILLICFVILSIAAAVAVTIFIKTFDANRFKPLITKEASKALSRQVDFERAFLAFSLRQGISLKINNLSIAEDLAFGKGKFLLVKEISLAVDVVGYFFKKEVFISNILIEGLRVNIIRQKDGLLNVMSIAQPAKNTESLTTIRQEGETLSVQSNTSTTNEKTGFKKSSQVSMSMTMPAVMISSLKGIHGEVSFMDYSFQPPIRLEITDLNFQVSKFSLTDTFPFVIEAALLSAKKNITIEGKAKVNVNTNEVAISGLKATIELTDLLMERIPVSFPMTKGAVLPASLKGKMEVSVPQLTAGSGGHMGLSADVSVTDAELQFKEIASPIKVKQLNLNLTEKDILLSKASAAIGEGLITASGKIEDYLAKQKYSIDAKAENLKAQDLIVQDKAAVRAEGIVSAEIKFKGEGFALEALQSSLSGDADLSVTKAKLKDINVLRTILDKISVIPGLAQKIEAGLPERFKQKLTQKDTDLSDIKLPMTVKNSRLVIEDTVLGADEFLFKGKGDAGFDASFSLEGTFLIPQELSLSMVNQVSELQYLLNDDKQIYFPLKISGNAGELKFKVDGEYIAKKLLVEQAQKQIFKAIDKFFGSKEEAPAAGSQAAPETQQTAPQEGSSEKSAVKEAVSGILDKLLKK